MYRTARQVQRVVAATLGAAQQLPSLVGRVVAIVGEVEGLVERFYVVSVDAAEVVARLDYTRAEAEQAIAGAEELRRRAEHLIDAIEPLIAVAGEIEVDLLRAAAAQLQPLVGALTEADLNLARDVAELVGRSRPLIDQVETLIMPFVRELRLAIPDVREILPVVQRLEPVMVDVETRIAGLPGSGRMRKRGEREIEEATGEAADGTDDA